MINRKSLLKWIAVLAILACALTGANLALAKQEPAGRAQNTPYAAIDDSLATQLSALDVPGAVLVIVQGDEIVHTKSFGVAGPDRQAPTPQTPFFIGSLSKAFTALAVMQLVEEGKIELEAPVQRYLPWFTLADPGAAAKISVRNLLNQTSGFSQTTGLIPLQDFDDSPGAGERQARALAKTQLAYPVGAGWDYSNMNFNLLGLIIESASGETYADTMQNHVYAPLDMRHSYTAKAEARQDGLATGHQFWFGFPLPVPDLAVPGGSLPSGQLIASAEDVAHFLIAQLNEGRYAGKAVLSPAGIAQMQRPAGDVRLGGLEKGDYGMGWFIDEAKEGRRIWHYGEVPDFFAYMALLPEQKRGLVLLVNGNQQFYTFALWAAAESAAASLAGATPQANAWGLLPWMLRASLLLPLVQAVCIALTLRQVKRWKENPALRPAARWKWLRYVLLPALPDLVLVLIAAALLESGLFPFLMLFMGDVVSLLVVCGGIALGWMLVRTRLILGAFSG